MPATKVQKKSKKPTASKKGTRTFVSFVLDESGSMESQRTAAISGFNEYVGGLKRDGSVAFTLTKFNTSASVVHDGLPIKDVPDLSTGTYTPGGETALYDAVGNTIQAVNAKLGKDERALIVVLTDGEENSSREFTQSRIRDMIQEREKAGNWTFVFLGATVNAWNIGVGMGVKAANAIKYDSANTKATMRAVSGSSLAYCADKSMRSCASFASLNASGFNEAGAEVHD